MGDVFLTTLTPVLTMLTYIAVGFFLGKKKLLPDSSDKTLSQLLSNIIAPAMNIGTFSKYCTVTSLKDNLPMLLISTAVCLVAIGIACALGGLFSKDAYQKNVYRYALAFSNSGYMGSPVVLVLLGQEGLYRYLLFCIPMTFLIYTWGLSILIPGDKGKKISFKKLLNPCVVGMLIGMVMGLTGITGYVPEFLTGTLDALSNTMGPLAMLLTGLVIAKFNLGASLKRPAVYVATFFRLILLPVLFLSVLLLCRVDSTTIKLCLFAYATPLGLNTVVFPSAYGGDPSTGASMALVSHSLCVLTIPLLYAVISVLI